jgi:hypothetical protein
MAVQPESLETLEKADVPPAQARAFVRAIEIELAGAKDTLATKHDLLSLGVEMRHEISNLRTEVHAELARLRTEVHAEMATLRTEVHAELARLRTEIHASASSTVRQMYMALLGQMAVLLGFAYFFATHVR